MYTFKIDALSLFLILLGVLVISILIGNWCLPLSHKKESFIAFDASSDFNHNIKIPQYSSLNSNVHKIYDNVFIDTENGNLIEVDSTAKGNTTSGNTVSVVSSEQTGSSISNVYISTRNAEHSSLPTASYEYPLNAKIDSTFTTPESQISFKNTNHQYVYYTQSQQTDSYAVFYIAWNDITLIHLINNTTSQHISTSFFGPSSSVYSYKYPNDSSTLQFTHSEAVPDISANHIVILKKYNPKVQLYQMSSQIYFDFTNGLIVIYDNITMKVYNRAGKVISDYSPSSTYTLDKNLPFTPWTVMNKVGNKLILCIAFEDKTVLLIIEPGLNGISYRIFNSQYFDVNGLIASSENPVKNNVDDSNEYIIIFYDDSDSKEDSDILKNAISDYYKWSFYWNSNANNHVHSSKSHNLYSDDYLLKTQIVPPVCPACPSCPANNKGNVCTNCGGNGGSGTQQFNGKDVYGNRINSPNSLGGVANNAIDDVTGIANNVIDTTGKGIAGAASLGKDTVSGAANLVTNAATGASNLATNAATGTVNLAKDTVKGTVDLAKDTVKGTIDLAKDAAYGITHLGEPTKIGQNKQRNLNGQGQYNQSNHSDIYSYYGAVPDRGGSNYMPISSDFSKFGR